MAQAWFPPPPAPTAGPFVAPYPAYERVPNGWATAGLIFGLLPTPLLGFVFSIVGIATSDERRHSNHGYAVYGLILSIVWTIIAISYLGDR